MIPRVLQNRINSLLTEGSKVLYSTLMQARKIYFIGKALAHRGEMDTWYQTNRHSTRRREALPISAIIRCRNAHNTLSPSVESIVAFVAEIWIIDNNSDALTKQIIHALTMKYPEQVRTATYTADVAAAGSAYRIRIRDAHETSLAAYYNFSFALGTQEYLLKWDADMVATATCYEYLAKAMREGYDSCRFDGYDLLGMYSCSCEERLFRRTLPWRFIDGALFEILELAPNHRSYVAPRPLYFHLKQFA